MMATAQPPPIVHDGDEEEVSPALVDESNIQGQ
jgi:hypothetical protein